MKRTTHIQGIAYASADRPFGQPEDLSRKATGRDLLWSLHLASSNRQVEFLSRGSGFSPVLKSGETVLMLAEKKASPGLHSEPAPFPNESVTNARNTKTKHWAALETEQLSLINDCLTEK